MRLFMYHEVFRYNAMAKKTSKAKAKKKKR